ncbi:hypothetical protein [Nocardioides sp. J54]|uniref:hypothetical protein n=1 Tax=Nocardioides sp. J54 TaxID=935866 RepID=UPI0012FAED1C|nr:hypothetical protein [Nocardioides sp. J54]
MVADVLQLGKVAGWKSVSRDVRAGAVVMAMAEFECLIKTCVEEVNSAIEQSGHAVGALRLGLRMLHLDSRFASASSSSLEKVWESRLQVADAHNSGDVPALPRADSRGFIQPLGSSTPKPAMIARLWLVYELPGSPIPKLSWRRALGELAEIRNDVAHARLPLNLALNGPDRSADAVAAFVLELRDLGRHIVESVTAYVDGNSYLA